MNRLILAFMALLAGLSAQVAPAAVRASEGTEIGAVAQAQLRARQAAAFAAAAEIDRAPVQHSVEVVGVSPLQSPSLKAATVRTGIDRARE